ncbi:MAG: hypothetical protein M3290_01815 [Actinomycetota bacterium]|nr:hypothetical protein [Actinomycetota bacterium]
MTCSDAGAGEELGDGEADGVGLADGEGEGDVVDDGVGLGVESTFVRWGPAYVGRAATADGHATAMLAMTTTTALTRMGSTSGTKEAAVLGGCSISNAQKPHIAQ